MPEQWLKSHPARRPAEVEGQGLESGHPPPSPGLSIRSSASTTSPCSWPAPAKTCVGIIQALGLPRPVSPPGGGGLGGNSEQSIAYPGQEGTAAQPLAPWSRVPAPPGWGSQTQALGTCAHISQWGDPALLPAPPFSTPGLEAQQASFKALSVPSGEEGAGLGGVSTPHTPAQATFLASQNLPLKINKQARCPPPPVLPASTGPLQPAETSPSAPVVAAGRTPCDPRRPGASPLRPSGLPPLTPAPSPGPRAVG